MAVPTVEQLQRPEPLHEVIAKDKPDDCLPCRVTGKLIKHLSIHLRFYFLTGCFQGLLLSLVWVHTAISQGIPS